MILYSIEQIYFYLITIEHTHRKPLFWIERSKI